MSKETKSFFIFISIIFGILILVLVPILIYSNTAIVEYRVTRLYDDKFIDGYFSVNVPSFLIFGNKNEGIFLPKYIIPGQKKVKELIIKRRVFLPFDAQIISAHSVDSRRLSIWVNDVREDWTTQVEIPSDLPFDIKYSFKRVKTHVDHATVYANHIYKKAMNRYREQKVIEEIFILK